MTAAEEPCDAVPAACTDPAHTHDTTPIWHVTIRTRTGTMPGSTINPALMVARLPAGWSVDRWTW